MFASRRIVLNAENARPPHLPSFDLVAIRREPALPPAPARAEPRPEVDHAARLAAEAEALRVRVQTEAWEAGSRQGHAAAREEWNTRLASLAQALELATRGLVARRVELAAEVERQLPQLLAVLVRKVLGRELAAADTVARTVVRAVAERLAGYDRPVTVRLHPDSAEAFEAWRREQPDVLQAAPSVRVEQDATLGPADWVIDTGDGFLDGRVQAQLEAAWDLLEEIST